METTERQSERGGGSNDAQATTAVSLEPVRENKVNCVAK